MSNASYVIMTNPVQYIDTVNNTTYFGMMSIYSTGEVIFDSSDDSRFAFKTIDMKDFEPYSVDDWRVDGYSSINNNRSYHSSRKFVAGVKCNVPRGTLFFYNDRHQDLSFAFVDLMLHPTKSFESPAKKYSRPPHTLSWYWLMLLLASIGLLIVSIILGNAIMFIVCFLLIAVVLIIGMLSISDLFGELITMGLDDLITKKRQRKWLKRNFQIFQSSI